MAQLIPSLATLVAAFSDCFHPQVFQTFQALLAGWITCQGPRTISEVWLATGLAAKRHHDTAYAVFHSACWEWDDLGIVTATLILTHLVPGGVVWIAVDDTLCHKRGAKVAFGGIFLDAVLSTKKHKTLRFGTKVQVTNERTGKSVVVRINDRGPYAHGRVIDLSKAAAEAVGIEGVGQVTLAAL